MLRLIHSLFAPRAAFEDAAENPPGFVGVLVAVLICLAVGCGAEAYGLQRWGMHGNQLTSLKVVPQDLLQRYLIFNMASGCLLVFVGAWWIRLLARGFESLVSYTSCLTVVSAGLAPIFLVRALDGYPSIPTWLCWGVGFMLAIRSVYHTVPMVLRVDPSKAFGLFIMAALSVGALSGLAHYVGWSVLREQLVLPF